MTANKGGRPKTITVTPDQVYWSRKHGNSWPQVAICLNISRSSAIKLYSQSKLAQAEIAREKENDRKRKAL